MPEQNEILTSTPEVSVDTKIVQPREIIVDQRPEAFAPRQVESFLQRIEKDPVTQSTTDPSGQPLLTASPPVNPKVNLPVTRTTFVAGFKQKFDDVGLWLSRFIFREIKLKDGNVTFKSNDS